LIADHKAGGRRSQAENRWCSGLDKTARVTLEFPASTPYRHNYIEADFMLREAVLDLLKNLVIIIRPIASF